MHSEDQHSANHRPPTQTYAFAVLAGGLSALLAGCHIPSKAAAAMVDGSVLQYNRILAEEKTALLLWNIARLRNEEAPHFMQASGLTTQFSATISAGGEVEWNESSDPKWAATLQGGGSFAVTPTITLLPLQGKSLAKLAFTPIKNEVLILLIWHPYKVDDAEDILKLVAAEFVGMESPDTREPWVVRNSYGEPPESCFPQDFGALAEELRKERRAENLRMASLGYDLKLVGSEVAKDALGYEQILSAEEKGLRWDVDEDDDGKYAIYARQDKANYALINFPEDSQEFRTLKRQLPREMGDDPFQHSLVPLVLKRASGALLVRGYIRLRNLVDILRFVASSIDVPDDENICPLRVHRSSRKPAEAAVSVRYKSQWYWIRKDDKESMRAFTTLFFIYEASLSDTAGILPVLTLPAGGK